MRGKAPGSSEFRDHEKRVQVSGLGRADVRANPIRCDLFAFPEKISLLLLLLLRTRDSFRKRGIQVQRVLCTNCLSIGVLVYTGSPSLLLSAGLYLLVSQIIILVTCRHFSRSFASHVIMSCESL